MALRGRHPLQDQRLASVRFLSFCLVLLFSGLGLTARCEAQQAKMKRMSPQQLAEAKRLTRQALLHYDLGEWDKAIAEFKRAYELSEAPTLLFNLAQAHRKKR